MTDNELTIRCAEAIGWKHLGAVGTDKETHDGQPWCLSGANDWWLDPAGHHVCEPCTGSVPDPLNNDAHAMALVKTFGLSVRQTDPDMWDAWIPLQPVDGSHANLNRAIVECVAKLPQFAAGEGSQGEKP